MIGCHKGFPNLAFLAFAVAQDRIDLGILAQLLCTQCHANSDGAALAQRARGRIHARNLFAVRMALQDAVKLAEICKFIPADESQFRQHRIVAGSSVALTQYETIPVGVFGISGINTHMIVEHAGHQLHHGQ